MDRRRFFGVVGTSCTGLATLVGCRGQQVGEVMKDNKKDLVGNTAAGAETFKPLVDEALGKLIAKQTAGVQTAGVPGLAPKRICFVRLDNKASEESTDFKEQLMDVIDTRINDSRVFTEVSRKFTEAGLATSRIRPDELFVPAKQREFLRVMETQGQPFDYLLFATMTSGTTRDGDATQKDYMLSLELIDIQTGAPEKVSASLRKAYRKSHGLR